MHGWYSNVGRRHGELGENGGLDNPVTQWFEVLPTPNDGEIFLTAMVSSAPLSTPDQLRNVLPLAANDTTCPKFGKTIGCPRTREVNHADECSTRKTNREDDNSTGNGATLRQCVRKRALEDSAVLRRTFLSEDPQKEPGESYAASFSFLAAQGREANGPWRRADKSRFEPVP